MKLIFLGIFTALVLSQCLEANAQQDLGTVTVHGKPDYSGIWTPDVEANARLEREMRNALRKKMKQAGGKKSRPPAFGPESGGPLQGGPPGGQSGGPPAGAPGDGPPGRMPEPNAHGAMRQDRHSSFVSRRAFANARSEKKLTRWLCTETGSVRWLSFVNW